MQRTKVSLKALEVFLAVCRRGALLDASIDLGISVSTASHHLSELEASVGIALLDRTRRPMRLTPAGEVMRKRADEALSSLRRGLSEIWSDDLASLVRPLRVALIEDFDADVGPALADDLIRDAPNCEISFLLRPTHEILDLLQAEEIDIGVAATKEFDGRGVTEVPLLRDPFVLVLPADTTIMPAHPKELISSSPSLPLLRYNSRQLLAQRIEAQLRRMGVQFSRRMEFETTHIILSLVAAGRGWTVTTALSFARAQRYHFQLRVLPFPGGTFSRQISVFMREDVPDSVTALSLDSMRRSIQQMVVDPVVARYPWISDQLRLFDARANVGTRSSAPEFTGHKKSEI